MTNCPGVVKSLKMGEAWINKYFTTNRAIAPIYRGGKSGQQRAMHRLIAGSFSVLAEEEQTVPQKITAFIRPEHCFGGLI